VQCIHCLHRYLIDAFLHFSGVFTNKVPYQQGDVLRAIAQGWHGYRKYIQPVVKIAAKPFLGDQLLASAGHTDVSFNLVDFYHNFSRLLGVDSYGLTLRQIAEITDELRPGFETGALKPPTIEIVPFGQAVDAYRLMAARQVKAKQVLSFG